MPSRARPAADSVRSGEAVDLVVSGCSVQSVVEDILSIGRGKKPDSNKRPDPGKSAAGKRAYIKGRARHRASVKARERNPQYKQFRRKLGRYNSRKSLGS